MELRDNLLLFSLGEHRGVRFLLSFLRRFFLVQSGLYLIVRNAHQIAHRVVEFFKL